MLQQAFGARLTAIGKLDGITETGLTRDIIDSINHFLFNSVIRRFFGDDDVMHVTLTQARG